MIYISAFPQFLITNNFQNRALFEGFIINYMARKLWFSIIY